MIIYGTRPVDSMPKTPIKEKKIESNSVTFTTGMQPPNWKRKNMLKRPKNSFPINKLLSVSQMKKMTRRK